MMEHQRRCHHANWRDRTRACPDCHLSPVSAAEAERRRLELTHERLLQWAAQLNETRALPVILVGLQKPDSPCWGVPFVWHHDWTPEQLPGVLRALADATEEQMRFERDAAADPTHLRLHAYPTPTLLSLDGVPCRLWRALDREGRRYDLYVHRAGSDDPRAQELLERELSEEAPPVWLRVHPQSPLPGEGDIESVRSDPAAGGGAMRASVERVAEALADIVAGWNAARADDDRGKGSDALCLTLFEDGSGRLGRRRWGSGEVEDFHDFDDAAGLLAILLAEGVEGEEDR